MSWAELQPGKDREGNIKKDLLSHGLPTVGGNERDHTSGRRLPAGPSLAGRKMPKTPTLQIAHGYLWIRPLGPKDS